MKDNIISIYNTEKKEFIGVFINYAVAARYVFNEKSTWNHNRIWHAFALKSRLKKNTIFDFPIAVRAANDKQIELLGDADYYISEPYPKFRLRKSEGVISCKIQHKNKPK